MLGTLRIRDLAVIESLQIEFGGGFCALTGETGAGKSILVDALTLVLGGKASADLIRAGAQDAEVEALFDFTDSPAAREDLAAAGFLQGRDGDQDPTQTEIVVRRLISRAGRGRAFINGRLESGARLFELGRRLVDIYGQHEYQTLLREDRHREALDSFGGHGEALSSYREAYGRLKALETERRELDLNETQKREREDLLRYRVREIESANLTAGEDEELARERERLRHAELLIQAGRQGVDYLYESDRAVTGGLRGLTDKLGEAASHDPWFKGPLEQVQQAAAQLEDAAHELRSYTDGIEDDPDRLAAAEDRLDVIRRLKKKYGAGIEEVLAALAQARAELDTLESQEERLRELDRRIEETQDQARALAGKLHAARGRTAKTLSKAVEGELAGLGMEKTRFEVRIEPLPDGALGPAGADAVEFLLSSNPGEPVKPLSRIASGGELSRIMLALRVLLSGEADVPIMVFDEVDQGVGGAVAESVGRRMVRLAAGCQVLCVTHLPQIASLADEHLLVIKHQDHDRTWTEIKRLDGEGRVEELSRMLAGAAITDAARAHAREMLRLGALSSGQNPKAPETAGQDAKPRRGARSRSLKE